MIKKILFLSILFSLQEKINAQAETKIVNYECPFCNNTLECYEDEIEKIQSINLKEGSLLLTTDSFNKLFPFLNLESIKKTMELICQIKNLLTNITTLDKNLQYAIKRQFETNKNCTINTNLDGFFNYDKALNNFDKNSFLMREENFDPSKEIITADGYFIPGKNFCTCSIINPFTKKIVNFIELNLLNNIFQILTKYIHSIILFLHTSESARWNSEQLKNYSPAMFKAFVDNLKNKNQPASYAINWVRKRTEQTLGFFCGKLN